MHEFLYITDEKVFKLRVKVINNDIRNVINNVSHNN